MEVIRKFRFILVTATHRTDLIMITRSVMRNFRSRILYRRFDFAIAEFRNENFINPLRWKTFCLKTKIPVRAQFSLRRPHFFFLTGFTYFRFWEDSLANRMGRLILLNKSVDDGNFFAISSKKYNKLVLKLSFKGITPISKLTAGFECNSFKIEGSSIGN